MKKSIVGRIKKPMKDNLPRACLGVCHFAAILVFVLSTGCADPTESVSTPKEPIRVELLEVAPETFRETIVTSAVAAAKEEHRVSAQIGGMLKIRHADRGDRVEKGEILFEMDPEEFELQVRERKANLARASAHLKFMEQELKRKKPLLEDGTLSRSQWDRVQFDLDTARADQDQALVALEQADRNHRLTTVRSPVNGTVLERYHDIGEVIPRGAVLAWIVDTSQIVFEVGLSGRELANVHRGDRVMVKVDAIPEQSYPGRITRLSGNASPGTGSFPVDITVKNSGMRILPGMVGRIEIPGKKHGNQIIIPLIAVQQQLEGAVVYVVEEDRAMKRVVSLGKVLGDRVVVLDGLSPGDRVVRVGQGRLETGIPVEVIQ